MNEAKRKVLLERMVEKGRRETAVILEFPKVKRPERKLFDSDSLFFASYGVLALSVFGVMVLAGSSSPNTGTVVIREPEPEPHDIWSFLGSRSGRAVINGTFKTLQLFASK